MADWTIADEILSSPLSSPIFKICVTVQFKTFGVFALRFLTELYQQHHV